MIFDELVISDAIFERKQKMQNKIKQKSDRYFLNKCPQDEVAQMPKP